MKSVDPLGAVTAVVGLLLIIIALIAIWWDKRRK